VTSKRKQLDEILKYAAERDIIIPADILLEIGKKDAQELINALRVNIADLPTFSLRERGLVPAPEKKDLLLWSTGWKPFPDIRVPTGPMIGGGPTHVGTFLRLDQTVPETVINGVPTFNAGLIAGQVQTNNYQNLAGTQSLIWDAVNDWWEFSHPLSLPASGLVMAGSVYNFTGGGTIGLGGFTLTVPATGTAALGTGTANYVSRWITANTLGNSIIRDDGTTVGLGIAPSAGILFNVYKISTDSGAGSTGVNFENHTVATAGNDAFEHVGKSSYVFGKGIKDHTNTLYGSISAAYNDSSGWSTALEGTRSSAGNLNTGNTITAIGHRINFWSPGAGTITNATGSDITYYHASVTGTMIGLNLVANTGVTGTNKYGIKIDNVSGAATLNYSIMTGTGLIQFGDAITANSVINPFTTAAESWIGPSALAGVYFKGGNVGLGTITPDSAVDIAGVLSFGSSGVLKVFTVDNVQLRTNYINSTDRLKNTAKESYSIIMGEGADRFVINRAPATIIAPVYAELLRITSTGTGQFRGSLEIVAGGSFSWAGTAPILRNSGTGAITWTLQNYAGAGVTIISGNAGTIPLAIKAAASQTANLVEYQDSSAVIHNRFNVPGAAAPLENVFNENGSQYLDFRVESDTNANMIFVDASADCVTFGSTTELARVGVDGTADEIQFKVQAHSTQNQNIFEIETSAGTDLITVDPSGNLYLATSQNLQFRANTQYIYSSGANVLDIVAPTLNVVGAGSSLGFYGHAATALQVGVPVTAAGIHAALVALGLITA